jgi:hypothetical protein
MMINVSVPRWLRWTTAVLAAIAFVCVTASQSYSRGEEAGLRLYHRYCLNNPSPVVIDNTAVACKSISGGSQL